MEETGSKAPEGPEWMSLRVLDVIQPAVQQNVKRSSSSEVYPWCL